MTELAVIETTEDAPEVIEPFTKAQAKSHTKKVQATVKKIESAVGTVQEQVEALMDQVAEAQQKQVHKALDTTWKAWFEDNVRIDVPDRESRQLAAKLMAGKGFSTRAIAAATGSSQPTISRDLEGEELGEVSSLDGKTRSRKKDEPEVIDAEVVEDGEVSDESEAEYEPMAAADIVRAFADEMANLVAAQGELTLLAQEDKWAGARKRVTGANLNNLQDVITSLQAIVDDLMGA